MYRIRLTEEQCQELHQRAQHKQVAPRTRQRLEMIRLSAKGWNVPKIAAHLEQHEQTVRYWVKRFLEGGFDALTDQPHPGKPSAVTPEMLAEVRSWLSAGEQTWSAPQIAAEVYARYGVLRSRHQWCRLLRGECMSYKRTRRSLQHKQNPEQVAAKSAELDALKTNSLKRGPTMDNSTCAISTKPGLP